MKIPRYAPLLLCLYIGQALAGQGHASLGETYGATEESDEATDQRGVDLP